MKSEERENYLTFFFLSFLATRGARRARRPQEIMLQQVMSQIAAVKKDMIILEKSEFSTLLAENEVGGSGRATLSMRRRPLPFLW